MSNNSILIIYFYQGTPVIVHAGPFANIAHGNSSIIGDKIALKLVGENGFVVTESGFGADIGMEKFFDIKCRTSELIPSCVIIVATVRALKMHGEVESDKDSNECVKRGCANLVKHIQNANVFGVPVIIAINKFCSDTTSEIKIVQDCSINAGAKYAVCCEHWEKGSIGAIDLAKAVVRVCDEEKTNFNFLYPLTISIESKITKIAKEMYGADGIELSELAMNKISLYEKEVCR